MTTIRDISDLVRILQEKPEWADILRGALLSQELLDLPQTFAKFVEIHREQMNGIFHKLDALEEGQARLEGGQFGLESRAERIERTVNDMRGEIGNLSGFLFQGQAASLSDIIARRDFGLRDTSLIHHVEHVWDNDLKTLLDVAAETDSLDFTQEDAYEVALADAVVRGSGPGGRTQYLLVEAWVTATPEDVANAARRANLLAIATGAPVQPLVIAEKAVGETWEAAASRSVPISLFQHGRAAPPQ